MRGYALRSVVVAEIVAGEARGGCLQWGYAAEGVAEVGTPRYVRVGPARQLVHLHQSLFPLHLPKILNRTPEPYTQILNRTPEPYT
jgi:hypothetical protein